MCAWRVAAGGSLPACGAAAAAQGGAGGRDVVRGGRGEGGCWPAVAAGTSSAGAVCPLQEMAGAGAGLPRLLLLPTLYLPNPCPPIA